MLDARDVIRWCSVIAGICLGFFTLFLVAYVIYKPIHRYQARADVKNNVKVTHQQIQVATQQVEVEKQHALVQKQIGHGQRLQNEEISAKLTGLFVQYSMVQALEKIATSGTNNSVVFIPAGANGIPLISQAGPQVFGGQDQPSK